MPKGAYQRLPRSVTLLERIFLRSRPGPMHTDGTRCREWVGYTEQGYAIMRIRGRKTLAHRVAYEQSTGERIPDDLTIDHLCRNRRCVNPLHMEIVTWRENTLRGVGPSALNARKTKCKRGHELRTNRAGRFCHVCHIARKWGKRRGLSIDEALEARGETA